MNERVSRGIAKWEGEYRQMISDMPEGSVEIVKSHLVNLNEYFLRWLGYCGLEGATPREMAYNDLLYVIEAASRVADADIAHLSHSGSDSAKQSWQIYKDHLTKLRDDISTIKVEAEKCYLKLKAFRSQLDDTPSIQ